VDRRRRPRPSRPRRRRRPGPSRTRGRPLRRRTTAGAGRRRRLAKILDQLGAAWTDQARAGEQLQWLEPLLARARADAAHQTQAERILAPLTEQLHTTTAAAQAAEAQAATVRALLEQRAQTIKAALRPDWDTDRPLAAEAARTLNAGPGRFGRGRATVADAQRLLDQWATKWAPVKPQLSDPAAAARFAAGHPANDRIEDALHRYAHQRAATQLPDHLQVIRGGEQARQDAQDAADAYQQTSAALSQRESLRHAHSGYRDLADDLPRLTEQTTTTRERLEAAQDRITRLSRDPAIAAHPDGETILTAARNTWQTGDTHTQNQAAAERAQQRIHAQHAEEAARRRMRDRTRRGPSYGPPGRDGPSLGR